MPYTEADVFLRRDTRRDSPDEVASLLRKSLCRNVRLRLYVFLLYSANSQCPTVFCCPVGSARETKEGLLKILSEVWNDEETRDWAANTYSKDHLNSAFSAMAIAIVSTHEFACNKLKTTNNEMRDLKKRVLDLESVSMIQVPYPFLERFVVF